MASLTKCIGSVLTLVQQLCVILLLVIKREAFLSDESSVNLIISTFLAEHRLFMDIRTSNPSIRIIYGVVYGKYPKYTIIRFLGNFDACANS